MEFGHDSYKEFFDKLQSNNGPRNLRQIFEDDDKPLHSESKNLRYQPQSSNKQAKHKQQYSVSQHQHQHQRKQHEHQQQEQKHKTRVHSPGPYNKHQDVTPTDCWRTVVAKVAHGFNGNDNVGRVGVALSRNSAGASKIVVYKSRSQLLSILLLTKSSQSSCPRSGPSNVRLRESYMQFYDDDRRFWSLRFQQPKDEQVFTEELLKLGLAIEDMRTEQDNKVDSNSPLVLPQALPHEKISTSNAEQALGYDSGSESTLSTENVVVPHQSCSNMNALIPLATSSSVLSAKDTPQANAAGLSPENKLELYLNEQRALDKKMDTILQAIYQLATTDNMELNENKDFVSRDPQSKFDSVLQAVSRMANKNRNQMGDSLDLKGCTTDNEDEILELEQKLLDLKKENRSLMKCLRAKEQALADLNTSTCILCEEILTQNKELKQQNSTLLSTLSNLHQNTAANTRATSPDNFHNCSYSTNNCTNCNKYLAKISELESRINRSESSE